MGSCGDCPAGYTNDGAKGCKDVNECASNNGGCDSKRECKNTVGSMSCGDCSAGYANDGAKGCKVCSNLNCPTGQFRSGSCSGTTNGYKCNTCSKLTCPTGQYRSGSCSGTTNGYKCNTFAPKSKAQLQA